MSIYPEILAGYAATTNLLHDRAVRVQHAGQLPARIASDPIALMNSFPDAYSVEVMVLREGANVLRNTRFGFVADNKIVQWPVATDAPDFEAKLGEVLLPVVDEFLRLAAEDKADKTAEDPNGPHESRDAIRRIS